MQSSAKSRQRSPRRLGEALLWLVFLVCAGYVTRAGYAMWSGARQPIVSEAAGSKDKAGAVVMPTANGTERLGTLEIPALSLTVPVFEGDDTPSLTRGVGHIPKTAMPGGLGTVALAGHRDTFLRSLAGVAPHMEIRVSGPAGVYRYQVDSTEIVDPGAVRVLETVDEPSLVLITCYPFHYIGAAPQRFIVHAHLVSLLPG